MNDFKINKKILDFETLWFNATFAKTLDVFETLVEAKIELMDCIDEIVAKKMIGDFKELHYIPLINEQIRYLNHNLNVLKSVMSYHENKVFEKRLMFKDLQKFCLN